jgi:iron-sulfur cluster insertion protein
MQVKPNAVTKLREIIAEDGSADLCLRVFVQGGGCSGFQYGFTLDQQQNDDDWDFDYDGVRVLVDSMSMQYLQGSVIDFREDAMGSNFVIDNPQATTTCGCGSSFAV